MTLPAFLPPLIQHLVHHYWHSIIAILPYLAATFSQHLPHPAPIDFTLLTISIRLSHTAVSLFSLPRLLPFPYPMMSSTPFPTTLYDSSLWNSSIMPIFPYRVILSTPFIIIAYSRNLPRFTLSSQLIPNPGHCWPLPSNPSFTIITSTSRSSHNLPTFTSLVWSSAISQPSSYPSPRISPFHSLPSSRLTPQSATWIPYHPQHSLLCFGLLRLHQRHLPSTTFRIYNPLIPPYSHVMPSLPF